MWIFFTSPTEILPAKTDGLVTFALSENDITMDLHGFKLRKGPQYPPRVVKGDLMGPFLRITVKRLACCGLVPYILPR